LDTFVTFRIIFFSALLALALGPVCAWLARRLGLVDIPNSAPHKRHGMPTSMAGGIVLFITVLIINLVEGNIQFETIRTILLPASVVLLFGLWDDIKDLPPLGKLAGQFLATGLLIYLGIYVQLFQQGWLNYTITVLWMVGVTNAYNFVDSQDGLAVGLAALASAFFMLVTITSQQNHLSIFSTILVGACIGVFYYNAAPATFFLGDSGSQFIGFTLAALGIAYNPLGFSRLASWYVPILLVGVPIFDATLVVFSRLRHGKPVYKAAFDHTYHRLTAIGMSSNRAVLTMHMAALLLGCLAFIALDLPPWIATALFGIVVLLGAIGIIILDFNSGKFKR
jgi:UDP-GlcNAc:undecaprenyl-phosphate GlcNAc-1-phosphate transferase